jgi:hypothetical protein
VNINQGINAVPFFTATDTNGTVILSTDVGVVLVDGDLVVTTMIQQPVGIDLTPVPSNPGGPSTIWTDGTNLFFGAIVIV